MKLMYDRRVGQLDMSNPAHGEKLNRQHANPQIPPQNQKSVIPHARQGRRQGWTCPTVLPCAEDTPR